MISKKKLGLIFTQLQEFEEQNSKFIDPEYPEPLYEVINTLLRAYFNKAQYGWIDWWIWENDFGKKKLKATQQTETRLINVDSFDGLWFIIKYLK